MGCPVVSISKSGEENEAQIKMNPSSEPLEFVLEADGIELDPADCNLMLKLPREKKGIVIRNDNGIAALHADDIQLADGIYPYSLCLDGKAIMSGYLLWGENDH